MLNLPVAPARSETGQDRAKTLLHILSTMLDRTPGLREALPRLRDLEKALPTRGMVALNDAPLPTLAEVQAALGKVLPHETPQMLQSRALLLSSLDRRKKPRKKNLPTYVNTRDVFSGEATISDFMDALGDQPRP
jgi:hypothetical protein